MTPLTLNDAALWDRACEAARLVRGLGFEALAWSIPLGREGSAFFAACPHEALRCAMAERSAAKAIAAAFGLDSASMAFLAPADGAPMDGSWGERQAQQAELTRLALFAEFSCEPLARAFAESAGASFDSRSFKEPQIDL